MTPEQVGHTLPLSLSICPPESLHFLFCTDTLVCLRRCSVAQQGTADEQHRLTFPLFVSGYSSPTHTASKLILLIYTSPLSLSTHLSKLSPASVLSQHLVCLHVTPDRPAAYSVTLVECRRKQPHDSLPFGRNVLFVFGEGSEAMVGEKS